ncbi:MAG: hypothetical protein AAB824_01830 [Patescibacteria group bacterium]
MYTSTWLGTLNDSFMQIWAGFLSYLPVLLGAVIIFLVGWIIAATIGRLIEKLIRTVKLDVALAKLGLDRLMSRANMRLDSGKFLGELVKWFLILVFLLTATDILGLSQVSDFLKSVLMYVPNIIIAVVIMLAAVVISSFLQRLVKASVDASGLKSGSFLGMMTKWAVLIFAVLAVLEQLSVAPGLVQTFFSGLMYTLALAVGLAFGLGGKEAAAEFLNKVRGDMNER